MLKVPGDNPQSSIEQFVRERISNEIHQKLIIESLLAIFPQISGLKTDFETSENDVMYSTNGSRFSLKEKKLVLSKRYILKGILRFFFYGAYVSLTMFWNMGERIPSRSITLVFGVESRFLKSKGKVESVEKRLERILNRNALKNSTYLFEDRKKFTAARRMLLKNTSFDLATYLFRRNFDTRKKLLYLRLGLQESCKIIFKYRSMVLVCPSKLLIEGQIWERIAQQDKLSLNLLSTQSKLSLLPVAYFHFNGPRCIVWYSNNSLPFLKKGAIREVPNKLFTSDLITDNFVWSESHSEYLRSLFPNSNVEVVGPILFEDLNSYTFSEYRDVDILLFDVTPFQGLAYETFYSPERCTGFISDIFNVSKELNLRIKVKPKRSYLLRNTAGVRHDRNYINLLNQLGREPNFEVIPAETQLELIISKSQIVIGMPFTSPVLVARALGINCIYYVPEELGDWELPPSRDHIRVIQGVEHLRNEITRLTKFD